MKTGMKKEKIFWGIFLIIAAVFLIVGKMGFLQGVGLWSILFAVFWIAILIKGIIRLDFGQILFPIAFLCIIFDGQLGIEALTPWTVLAAALLGTIGLNLLFHRKKRSHKHFDGNKHVEIFVDGEEVGNSQAAEIEDGEHVYCEANFGSTIKYVNSNDFRYASLDCSFGAMKVYFDGASIPSGHATVELSVSFAGVELYVPREWNVVINAKTFCGVVDEKGRNKSDGTPILTLTGSVSFSGVTVIYV